MAKSNGAVIYRGPSRIDGAPIVVLAVGLSRSSTNTKTGGMVQTYILREDVNPVEALGSGADASICGGCPHRPQERYQDASGRMRYRKRSCYVNVAQGPLVAWKAFKAGKYPTVSTSSLPSLFAGRLVRLGSYGDPAAVPLAIWQLVLSQSAGHTGYTHQWKSERLRDVTAFCQASVDSDRDVRKAESLGLGYFRVKASHEPTLPGEIVCPASAEAGKTTTCDACGLCNGAGRRVVINAHGIGAGFVESRRALPVLA